MNKRAQRQAPLHQALLEYMNNRVVRFDVPGHKGGRGSPELTAFLGHDCLSADVNSMKPLDNLCHPTSVIAQAEELASDAFGSDTAFFLVGGTTSSIQAMIMYACKQGEEIIMPRNVHRSAINALVVCGATPVYVNPDLNHGLGISLGMTLEAVAEAIQNHPNAKAVFVNNPTYYGICSNLVAIVELAHRHGMLVLVDEAHGTHFYFDDSLPVSAMSVGADMAAVSMHKTGGSLTQSSILLCGKTVNPGYMRQIINLTQTTSASYLLLSSLDIARKNLAMNGEEIFGKTVGLAEYARQEINNIGGYRAFGRELINGDAVFDFDTTKLSVHTRGIGLAGIEVYDILRDDYDIQIEFGDIANILAIISFGDRFFEIERLVAALSDIKRQSMRDPQGMLSSEYIPPTVVMSPQKAFYSEKTQLPLEKSVGKICGEFVMCYPPGIPILAPGEVITHDVIEYIKYAKAKGSSLTGTEDIDVEWINTL